MSGSRSKSVTGMFRSAKESAMKMREMGVEKSGLINTMMATAETSSQKGSELLGRFKAKAQTVAEAAAAAASAASATPERKPVAPARPRSRMAPRVRSAARRMRSSFEGKAESPSKVETRDVEKLCKLGVSPVAARLALCRSGGGVNQATTWLYDEANAEEILAAEAAEIWAAEMLERKEKDPVLAITGGCTEEFLAQEECLFEAKADENDDDGRGLGLFISRDLQKEIEEQASQLPKMEIKTVEPSTSESAEKADGPFGAICRSYQKGLEDSVDEDEIKAQALCKSPSASSSSRPSVAADSDELRMSNAPTQASAQGDLESCSGVGEESASEEALEDFDLEVADDVDDVFIPEPPDGGSWEWPLSRTEKKARVHMADLQMQELDKKALLKALVRERMVSRSGRK